MPPASGTRRFEGEQSRQDAEGVYVSLTYDPLNPTTAMDRVKSPKAGAIVLFAGTTRSTFASKPITHLSYSTYAPLALQTLSTLAKTIKNTHNLTSISITHRLGRVDIGQESILIAISSPHRQGAWKAGEECLEEVKKKVEIWKEEWFEDGGVWRSNRDGQAGVPVVKPKEKEEEGVLDGKAEVKRRGTGEFSEGGFEM